MFYWWIRPYGRGFFYLRGGVFRVVIAGGGLSMHWRKLLNCTGVAAGEGCHWGWKWPKGSITMLLSVFFRGLSDKSLKFPWVFADI